MHATQNQEKGEQAMSRKPKKIRFKLTVEAQEMIVDYQPHWLKDVGHFEFRSPHEPPRRIPISETGYRSHFADMDDIEATDSPQEYAREVVLASLRRQPKAPVEADDEQLALF
jgi:hypothetical protein